MHEFVIFILLVFTNSCCFGQITNFTCYPLSRNSARVRWDVIHETEPSPQVNYKINYCELGASKCSNNIKLVGDKTSWGRYIGGLTFHKVYQFRIQSDKYPATEWMNMTMDVKSYELNAELKLYYKKQFKKELKTLLPSTYLMSKEISHKRIEAIESWVDVLYEVYFPIDANTTKTEILDSLKHEKIGNISSYLRSTSLKDKKFCGMSEMDCDRNSICYNRYASFSCKCKLGYIDISPYPTHFPGKKCILNTAPPTYTKMRYVGRNKVIVECRPPYVKKAHGTLTQYEVQWKNNSGEIITTGSQFFPMEPFPKLVLTGLTGTHYYDVRVRAITTVGPGSWSKWFHFHMMSDLYQLEFDIELFDHPDNYEMMRSHVHESISKQIFTAVRYDKDVNISDFETFKTEIRGQGKLSVWNKIFFTKKPLERPKPVSAQLYDYKVMLMKPLQKALNIKTVGKIIEGSIKVKDYSECRDPPTGCSSINGCQDLLGSYRCVCPRLTTDISEYFQLEAGRVCTRIQSPPEFRASLRDRETIRLSWKVPPKLRNERIEFVFVLRMKMDGETKFSAKRVQLPYGNVSDPNFVVFSDREELNIGKIYHFQVAAQVGKYFSQWTKWMKMETSDYVFMANLTLQDSVEYNYDLIDQQSQTYKQLISHVYNAVDKTLKQPMPQFISSGEAVINRKNSQSSNVVVTLSLFFDPKSKLKESYIEEKFHQMARTHTDEKIIDFSKTVVLDYDECESEWNNCNESSSCINQQPGFICQCFDGFKDWSHLDNLSAGRSCVPEDYTTTVSTTTEEVTTTPVTTPQPQKEEIIKYKPKLESDDDSIYGGMDAFDVNYNAAAGTGNVDTGSTNTGYVGTGNSGTSYVGTGSSDTSYVGTESAGTVDVGDVDVVDGERVPQNTGGNIDYRVSPNTRPPQVGKIPQPATMQSDVIVRTRPYNPAGNPSVVEVTGRPPVLTRVMTRITTPPTTTIKLLPMPKLQIYGRGIDKTTLLLTWKRRRLADGSNQANLQDLRYIFRYKIKGTIEWIESEISAQLTSLTFTNLMENVVYLVCVAEQWARSSEPHTSFSIPIEVRVVVHSYLVHLHVSDVRASGLSHIKPGSQQYQYLNYITSKYVRDVLSMKDIRAQFPSIVFGSTGKETTFNRHPDETLTAFVKIYMTPRRELSAALLQQAFKTTEQRVKSEVNIKFWLVTDIDECGNEKLNDCPHSSTCTNTEGSYYCSCTPGYFDDSSFYYLLAGRFCNVPTTASTITEPATTIKSNNKNNNNNNIPNDLSPDSGSNRPTKNYDGDEEGTFVHPNGEFIYEIQFNYGQCPNGQLKVGSKCSNVKIYRGELDVFPPPNSPPTNEQVNDIPLKAAVQPKISTILSNFEYGDEYEFSQIENIITMKSRRGVRVMFIAAFKPINGRWKREVNRRTKRQVNIFGMKPPPKKEETKQPQEVAPTTHQVDYKPKKKMTAFSIEESVKFYLNKNPRSKSGFIDIKIGKKVPFVLKNVRIMDINECTNNEMNDCDDDYGKCSNNDGGFTCSCSYFANDISIIYNMRPGRRCTIEKPEKPEIIIPPPKEEEEEEEEIDGRSTKLALWTIVGVSFVILCITILHCRVLQRKLKKEQRYGYISSRETSNNSSIRLSETKKQKTKPPKTPTNSVAKREDREKCKIKEEIIPPQPPPRNSSLHPNKPKPLPYLGL